jgi:quinol monooxygenase YgiN
LSDDLSDSHRADKEQPVIVISGLMEVSETSADDFAAMSRDLVGATRREPGCTEYRFARSIENPQVFEIFEEFADQEAFDEHVRAEHYRSWNRALKGVEVVRVSITRYDATIRTVLV